MLSESMIQCLPQWVTRASRKRRDHVDMPLGVMTVLVPHGWSRNSPEFLDQRCTWSRQVYRRNFRRKCIPTVCLSSCWGNGLRVGRGPAVKLECIRALGAVQFPQWDCHRRKAKDETILPGAVSSDFYLGHFNLLTSGNLAVRLQLRRSGLWFR